MDQVKKQAARGAMWASIETMGVRSVTFITFIVMARQLESEDMGLMALAMVYISFVLLLLKVGVGEVVVQRDELTEIQKCTAFWLMVLLGFAAYLFSLAIAPLAATWSSAPELESVIDWLALSIIPISLSRVQQGLLMRELRYKSIAIRRLLASTSGAIVGITMAFKGYGVWSLVAQQLVDRLVDFITLYWATNWYPRLRFSLTALKAMTHFGVMVMGNNVIQFLGSSLDRLLVGQFFGVSDLGVYSVARRLVDVLLAIMRGVISRVALSAFSRVQRDKARLNRGGMSVARITSVLAFPVFGFLIFAGNEVVVALFGEKWRQAGPLFQVIAIAGLIRVACVFMPPLLKAVGYPGRVLLANAMQAVLSVLLAAAFSYLGLLAFTTGWAAGELAFVAACFYWIGKLTGFPVAGLARLYAGPLIAALGAALGSDFLISAMLDPVVGVWVVFGIKATVYIMLYFLVLAVVAFPTLSGTYQEAKHLVRANLARDGGPAA